MRQKPFTIVANWKMNGLRADGEERLRALAAKKGFAPSVEIVLCPPATLLHLAKEWCAGTAFRLGGQDCSPAGEGAYTGDISAGMLKDAGCSYVILGHSERRRLHGERDAQVRAKAEAALSARLTPIICVGETLEEREDRREKAVVAAQLKDSVPTGADRLLIAYEPVWAIGSGRTPSLEDIAAIHRFIIETLSANNAQAPVIYGGSVTAQNAAQILAISGVSGVLVGGASLDVAAFSAICGAAGK